MLQNLFENARRYGRSDRHRHRQACRSATRAPVPWVILTVRDFGQGADPKKLCPADHARSSAATPRAPPRPAPASGLAIVDKAVQRMGGTFELANAPDDGGLMAHIRLKKAP